MLVILQRLRGSSSSTAGRATQTQTRAHPRFRIEGLLFCTKVRIQAKSLSHAIGLSDRILILDPVTLDVMLESGPVLRWEVDPPLAYAETRNSLYELRIK